MGNHAYAMDYIADKPTYKAVMFACDMLKKGTNYSKAVSVACKYYGANPYDVRHYLSQRSGRAQANRRNSITYNNDYENEDYDD